MQDKPRDSREDTYMTGKTTTTATTQWLYRVLEQDDEGDPLDFGAVTAASLAEAQELVAAHLTDIVGDCGWLELPVRFYPVTRASGVWETSSAYIDTDVVLPASDEVERDEDDEDDDE